MENSILKNSYENDTPVNGELWFDRSFIQYDWLFSL